MYISQDLRDTPFLNVERSKHFETKKPMYISQDSRNTPFLNAELSKHFKTKKPICEASKSWLP